MPRLPESYLVWSGKYVCLLFFIFVVLSSSSSYVNLSCTYYSHGHRCSLSLSLSLQSSAVEQVLDILMDILSWEIAEVVSPCLPRGLWSHIVIRVFILLGTVCLWHPPYPLLRCYPLVHSRGRSPIRNLGTRVVAIVPQPSASLSHQQTPPDIGALQLNPWSTSVSKQYEPQWKMCSQNSAGSATVRRSAHKILKCKTMCSFPISSSATGSIDGAATEIAPVKAISATSGGCTVLVWLLVFYSKHSPKIHCFWATGMGHTGRWGA